MKNQAAQEQEEPGDVPRGLAWKGATFGKALVNFCFLKAPKPTSTIMEKQPGFTRAGDGHGFAAILAQEEILPAGHSPSVNHISLIQTPCYFLVFALSHAEQVCFVSHFPEWANNGNYPALLTGCSLLSPIS